MVYTKTGDKGTTSLVGGRRVKKFNPRVEAYGTVDELNSHIGLLAEMVSNSSITSITSITSSNNDSSITSITSSLKKMQDCLFVIQTLLATEDESIYQKLPQLKEDAVAEVEHWIDEMEAKLPKHNRFVIPGGSLASAQAHVCRTVCRRAEREIVRLTEEETIEENIMKYINRTSDYLFVLSRYILLLEEREEHFWNA